MKFEVHRQSNIRRGDPSKPCPEAVYNDLSQRWEVEIADLPELLALGCAVDSPLVVLAVGGDEEDLHVIEVRDDDDLPHQVDRSYQQRGG